MRTGYFLYINISFSAIVVDKSLNHVLNNRAPECLNINCLYGFSPELKISVNLELP